MSLRRRDITGRVDAPCESPFDLDARRRIVSDLCESIAEQIGGDVEAAPEPADPSEAHEREGALASRRKTCHHLFEEKSRPVGVSRLEMAPCGFNCPPPTVGVIGRRKHSCPVPELRCGLRGPTRSYPSGSILEGHGHLRIRAGRGEGEMERLLVRIADDLRQAGVQFASPRRRCLRVDNRGKQRMREPHAASGDLQDSRRCRLLERGRPTPTEGGGIHELDGRARERRDDQSRLPRLAGNSGQPLLNELIESRRDRQRLPRRG
jgi:hypothetical protein